jgi:hypothetical protein
MPGRLAVVGSFVVTTVMVLGCLAVLVAVALVFTWVIDRAVELVEHDVAEHSHSATELTPGDRYVTDVYAAGQLQGSSRIRWLSS